MVGGDTLGSWRCIRFTCCRVLPSTQGNPQDIFNAFFGGGGIDLGGEMGGGGGGIDLGDLLGGMMGGSMGGGGMGGGMGGGGGRQRRARASRCALR